MKIKQSVLAAAVTAALAIGAVGEAAATVYAGSRLDIDNLRINIIPPQLATSFNFDLSNTATLNNVSATSGTGDPLLANSCGGIPAPTGPNSCGGAGSSLVLNAGAANAPGGPAGSAIRLDNVMTFFGPGGDYANSDSVINDAQLVGDGATDTDNIAEASLDSLASASARSELQSVTGFRFTFTINAPGSLALSFDADPDMRALVTAAEGIGSTAGANLNTSFSLQQDTDLLGGTLGSVNWNPQGTSVNDCTTTGGLICTETADTQDLNINVGATTPGASPAVHSFGAGDLLFGDALTAFGISVSNLKAGTWTLTLNEVKSVNLRRVSAVPEPGALALMGIGLLGLGISARRKKFV